MLSSQTSRLVQTFKRSTLYKCVRERALSAILKLFTKKVRKTGVSLNQYAGILECPTSRFRLLFLLFYFLSSDIILCSSIDSDFLLFQNELVNGLQKAVESQKRARRSVSLSCSSVLSPLSLFHALLQLPLTKIFGLN